jgi:hypothetical protein
MTSRVAFLPMKAEAQALKGHLDTLLLAALEAGPRHGYAVKEALREGSDGRFDLPTGTVYPALYRLEDAGLITGSWSIVDGRRRHAAGGATHPGPVAVPSTAVLLQVFHRRLRWCAAGLCLTGTGLAGVTAVLASARLGAAQALVFAVVAACLAALAVAVLRAVRPALWLTAVVLAGQITAVAGTIWELAAGVDDGKAGQLRRLGFDPTLGVLINLAYSAIATSLFGWLAVRWWRVRRARSVIAPGS